MGIRDTFHFDEDAYRRKNEELSSKLLKTKYGQKMRLIVTNSFCIGMALALAPPSVGGTVLLVPFLLRQIIVVACQACIIKEVLRSRGGSGPRIRKRDIVAGLSSGAVSFVSGPIVGTKASALITDITASGALYHGAERLMSELSEVVVKYGVGPVGLQDLVELCSKAIGKAGVGLQDVVELCSKAIGKAGGSAAGSAASETVRAVAAGGSAASETVRAVADKVLGSSGKDAK